MASRISRRSLLVSSLFLTAGQSMLSPSGDSTPSPIRPLKLKDPFTLGVASGDPRSDGFVLWTRLAPKPLADDGHAGMPARTVEVDWQVATDEQFRDVVRSGLEPADPAYAHSLHLELSDLEPAREYFYRFRVGKHVSPVGRTRTAPAPDTYGLPLRMAMASCAHYENGYFTAYRAIADDEVDLVLHLGDYIYEGSDVGKQPKNSVRSFEGAEADSLAEYRVRHAQYKTDADLRAAHASAPWVVVFDDHEVDNNWAGEISQDHPEDSRKAFRKRRAAAFRAFYENLPLRRSALPDGSRMRLHRRVRWGRLATFHMLDCRQYRDDQPCDDGWSSTCEERRDPKRQMLGKSQERWLFEGLANSETAWNFLGQQVAMAQHDRDPGPATEVPLDTWDGYTAARKRLMRKLAKHRQQNPIVLTGDSHINQAAELHVRADDVDSPRATVELCVTSVTSGGDGEPSEYRTDAFDAENPAVKFWDYHRGYVRSRVMTDHTLNEFRTVPYVSRRGASASTLAAFAVESGSPVLHEVDNPRVPYQVDDPPATTH